MGQGLGESITVITAKMQALYAQVTFIHVPPYKALVDTKLLGWKLGLVVLSQSTFLDLDKYSGVTLEVWSQSLVFLGMIPIPPCDIHPMCIF